MSRAKPPKPVFRIAWLIPLLLLVTAETAQGQSASNVPQRTAGDTPLSPGESEIAKAVVKAQWVNRIVRDRDLGLLAKLKAYEVEGNVDRALDAAKDFLGSDAGRLTAAGAGGIAAHRAVPGTAAIGVILGSGLAKGGEALAGSDRFRRAVKDVATNAMKVPGFLNLPGYGRNRSEGNLSYDAAVTVGKFVDEWFSAGGEKRAEMRRLVRGHVPDDRMSLPGDSLESIVDKSDDSAKPIISIMADEDPARRKELLLARSREFFDTIEKSNQAILQGIGETVAVGGKTFDVAAFLKSDAERRLEAERAQIRLDGLRATSFMISSLVGVHDRKLGTQMAAIGNAAIEISSAITAFKAAAEITSGLAEGLAAAAMTGNIVGAVMTVVNALLDTGPSFEQVVLEEIGALRDQVEQVRKEMHGRFDRIERQIAGIGRQLADSVEMLSKEHHAIMSGLRDIRSILLEQGNAIVNLSDDLEWHSKRTEEWFRTTVYRPCLVHAERSRSIPPDYFASCRNRFEALGASEIVDRGRRQGEPTAGDFRDYPDDMTQAGLDAFRRVAAAGAADGAGALPDKVMGPQRFAAIAGMYHRFLSQWPDEAGQLTGGSTYTRNMQARRAALRAYTRAVREHLGRFNAGERGGSNAFESELSRIGDRLARLEKERAAASRRVARSQRKSKVDVSWYYHRDLDDIHDWYKLDGYRVTGLSKDEIERIVRYDRSSRPRVNFLAQWNLDALKDYAPSGYELSPDEPNPGGLQPADRYMIRVVRAVISGVEDRSSESFALLLRQGLMNVRVSHRPDYDYGKFNWRLCGERCWPRGLHRGWRRWENGDRWYGYRFLGEESDELIRGLKLPKEWDQFDSAWRVAGEDGYRFDVELSSECRRGRGRYRVTGEYEEDFEFDILLGHGAASSEIAAMRSTQTSRHFATRAMRDLRNRLGRKRLARKLFGDCRSEMRDLYDRRRKQAAQLVLKELEEGEAKEDVAWSWKEANREIDLSDAHIRSWVRIALFDAAETTPRLEALLNGKVGIKSPATLMRNREASLWESVEAARKQLERLRTALRSPVVLDKLRNEYGHRGVMQAEYLGIDAMAAAAPQAQ